MKMHALRDVQRCRQFLSSSFLINHLITKVESGPDGKLIVGLLASGRGQRQWNITSTTLICLCSENQMDPRARRFTARRVQDDARNLHARRKGTRAYGN
jgi:hypothetical protein